MPEPEIVEAVAGNAFAPQPQRSEFFPDKDIRPFARSTLAQHPQAAAEYAAQAFGEMSSADALGTGAAQIAAAGGHPDALSRIEQMMRDLLASQTSDPVRYATRNRLYELAYALTFAGPAGRQHTGPLLALMDRKVASDATMFGLVPNEPKRMCAVLNRLYQPDVPPRTFAYCDDPKVAYDQ